MENTMQDVNITLFLHSFYANGIRLLEVWRLERLSWWLIQSRDNINR
jgi:hypothetical protein